MLEAAFWGLVGGLALVLGAAITFVRRPSERLVAFVMAFGSGVLISAVAYDLTADAFDLGGGDAVAVGLAAGALVYAGASRMLNRRATGPRAPAGRSRLGALLDGIPESAAIGLTLVGGGGVSAAFVVAVFISNIPESFSSTAELRSAGRSQARRSSASGPPSRSPPRSPPALGYELLGGASEDVQAARRRSPAAPS